MADPASLMAPYLKLDQPDPYGTLQKLQTTITGGQVIETNRRTLEGQRAAGIAVQQATGADGTLDPEVGYSWIKANVAPEFQPSAVAAFQAAEAGAIANRAASAKSMQDSIGFGGQYGGAFLATHPGGISSKDASELVGDLLANKAMTKGGALAFQRILQHAKTDDERRIAIGQWYINSMGPAGMSERVPVTMKDGTPGFVTAGGLVAASVGGVKPKKLPLPSPAAGEPEPEPEGEAVAGSEVVATEPSAAQKAVMSGVSGEDAKQRDKDIAASHAAPANEADLKSMLAKAAHIRLGPATEDLTRYKALLNQLIPGADYDIEGTSMAEVFMKTAAAFARRQGGGGTDMDRGQALISNPNPHLSNLGLNMIAHQLLGDLVEAPKKKALEIRKVGDDAKQLNDFYQVWDSINPQVWQYAVATPEERPYLLGAWRDKTGKWQPIPDPATGEVKPLTEGDMIRLEDFENDFAVAKGKGWLSGIASHSNVVPEVAK